MAKVEKKSIADLVGSRTKRPSLEEIENITSSIHQKNAEQNQKLPEATTANVKKETSAPKKTATPEVKETPIAPAINEKIKRISVNTSVQLYLKAKTKATMQDQTLMAYIIDLIEKDVKGM